MGQTRRTPPPPAADPLADLREPDAAGLPGAAPAAPVVGAAAVVLADPEADLEVGRMVMVVSSERLAEMVSEGVAAFHADPTAHGFTHSGGACGCRYLVDLVLRSAVPVELASEEDPEGSDG